MTRKMLIDATHAEETRVAVMDGNRLDEYDYESASRRTLKGNIYLGKVTRVEPSLQAAFIDYGGNRHGFLPFSDIHPDYYRIPVADREALLSDDVPPPPERENGDDGVEEVGDTSDAAAEEEINADRRKTERLRHAYKIQEVIKRRQILLVQVTKEERGNKGAALTTYISLAGRYCVLMPNTMRGGGISRKITNTKDRRRLKDLLDQLPLPEGMAIILRTAGVQRTKTEIKRDYDFLIKLWDDIRERTLSSRAPALIYEEANLIKRTIRDIYTRDIDEVLVEGEDAYRTAKDFMRALMPSHARRVQLYKDKTAHLFSQQQVESQIEALHSSTVRLKSGGSIVINSTEALVAIDVNSGRSTRERNIEETALKTNLEAAVEVARQLRLRDLAGLIVIDFIDMEDRRNNGAVERRLKEAVKSDRARLQLGRISPLGLFEMSRQRLRPSLFDTSMQVCPVCHGHGHVRSVESTALHVLRAIEEEAARGRSAEIAVYVPIEVALYMLNQKRDALYTIEKEQGLRAVIERDDELVSPTYRIEHRKDLHRELEAEEEDESFRPPIEAVPEPSPAEPAEDREASAEDGEGKSRRRRRGRRGGRRRARRADELTTEGAGNETEPAPDSEEEEPAEQAASADAVAPVEQPEQQDATEPAVATDASEPSPAPSAEEEEKPKRSRPRRRKSTAKAKEEASDTAVAPAPESEEEQSAEPQPKPKPTRRRRTRKTAPPPAEAETEVAEAEVAEAATSEPSPAPSGEAPAAEVGVVEAFVSDVPRPDGVPEPEQQPEPEHQPEPAASFDTGEEQRQVAGEPGPTDAEREEELALAAAGGPLPEAADGASVPQGDPAEEEAQPTPSAEEADRPRRRGWWQRLLE